MIYSGTGLLLLLWDWQVRTLLLAEEENLWSALEYCQIYKPNWSLGTDRLVQVQLSKLTVAIMKVKVNFMLNILKITVISMVPFNSASKGLSNGYAVGQV